MAEEDYLDSDKEAAAVVRKFPLLLLLILSLFSPFGALICPVIKGQVRGLFPIKIKLTDDLISRLRQTKPGSGERVRVIVTITEGTPVARARSVLLSAGANITRELEHVGMMVADLPVERLTELAVRDEVSWVSADQEVRALQTSTTNTSTTNNSHVEVSTGASKVLPLDQNGVFGSGVANGGAGNHVGIAVLDSGITGADAAEFAGYEWQSSGGLLGLGLTCLIRLHTFRLNHKLDLQF